jgi:nucleoside-diphosphate-sugar epimerase
VITVLGASGFIGSHLAGYLTDQAIDHQAWDFRAPLPTDRHLGHVIYCVGLTADFRSRPHDAIDAHVCRLNELVRSDSFDSLIYLSSTRVYRRNNRRPAREDDLLKFDSGDFDDLYALSKAVGESIVLASPHRGRVVRLSNVYGSDIDAPNFLSAVIRQALVDGVVELESTLESERDYVSVDDVVAMLTRIALEGTQRVYNVASGRNTSTAALMQALARLTGSVATVSEAARTVRFPPVDVSRITREFGFAASDLIDDLPRITQEARTRLP